MVKKLLAIILMLICIAIPLASCGDTDVEETNETVQTEEVKINPVDPDAPPIPTNIDISGEFRILNSGNMERNDFAEIEEWSSVVNEAIFRRNATVKDLYGIEIVVDDVTKLYSSNGSGTAFQKLYTDYMSGQSTYDAAMVGTGDVGTLAYNGVLWDLSSLPYIDLTKEYWDQKANQDLRLGGKMFYSTGDISIIDNVYTHCMLFNKDLVAEYNMENPYDLVRNDQWTLEKFSQLVKQVGEDLDSNGIYDANDMYGLLNFNDTMHTILVSAGEKMGSVNENGELELTLYNERVLDLYSAFDDLVFDQKHVYNYQYDNVTGKASPSDSWDTNRDLIFNENRAVFYFHMFTSVPRYRDSELEFGILPYPKMNEYQEEYGHSISSFRATFVCIPLLADPVRSGAVVELLAHYGKEYLTPAYYEQTLVGRYTRDAESAEMLDIIFDTRVYDVGNFYAIGDFSTVFSNRYITRSPLTSLYETNRPVAEAKVKMINDSFKAISDVVVYSADRKTEEENEKPVDTSPYTNATVVYLASSGKGNGSTAESAIGTMKGALDALDLSKDCTVVICGKYVLGETFQYTDFFDGSVTVTSIYDGVDYREQGAEIIASGVNFVCSGEYIFRDLDFHFMDKYFRILASHYPITMDTGLNFKIGNSGMNGKKFGESVCILGGHYQGTPVLAGGEKPVDPMGGGVIDITINSGSHYCIGVFSHSLENSIYPGNNVINIGGDAQVPTLWILPENAYFEVGDVEVNVTDNAAVDNIYGASKFGTVNKVTINWLGGTINNFEKSRDKKNPDYEAANGTHLVYSEAVAGHPNLEILTERFDSVTQK